MAHTLPDLPYAYDALEPHIDAQTMEIHHTKHHQTYINNLNDALKDSGKADTPVEQLIADIDALPEKVRKAVRNNGGGHANHSFFWTIMAPNAGGPPTGAIAEAIDAKFGSFDAFKEAFAKAATGRFGSGWAWLIKSGAGVDVTSTANQDSPLMEGKTPLLGLDVWEHAYYLKYQNKRPDYLTAIFNVIDWKAVGERYAKAKG